MKLLNTILASLPVLNALPKPMPATNEVSHMDESVYTESCAGWAYGRDWNCAYCKGQNQSPIDIVHSDVANELTPDQDPLKMMDNAINVFLGQKHTLDLAGYKEGSHAHQYSFNPEVELPDVGYRCAQYHLHVLESEHTFEGKHYDGELHIVCYKSSFADLTAAVTDNNHGNLAVMGFFLEIEDDAFDYAADWVKVLKPLDDMFMSNDALAQTINMPILRAHKNNDSMFKQYYRYKGSLTTPTCNEVVTWTVFKQPLTISKKLHGMLYSLQENSEFHHIQLLDNSRPTTNPEHNSNPVTFYNDLDDYDFESFSSDMSSSNDNPCMNLDDDKASNECIAQLWEDVKDMMNGKFSKKMSKKLVKEVLKKMGDMDEESESTWTPLI